MNTPSKRLVLTYVGIGELLRNARVLGKVEYRIEIFETPNRPDEISGFVKAIDKIDIADLPNQELQIQLKSRQYCRCKIVNTDGQISWIGKAIFMSNLEVAGMEESMQWHTVGIVSNYKGLVGKGIGTGSAIQWKEHRIILTAAHVVADTELSNLWFFFRPEGAIQRVESTSVDSAYREAKQYERISLPIMKVIMCEEEDLALLALPHDFDLNQRVHFFNLESTSISTEHESPVLLIGYPSDLSIELAQGSRAVFTSIQWTNLLDQETIIRESKYLKDFNPMKHLLAPFTNAWVAERHPRGFSGAGGWFRKGPSVENVWNSNLGFADIVTDYYENKKLLKMAKVEVVKDFLDRELK